MEEGCIEKRSAGVSLVPPEKRPRTTHDDEDEEDSDITLNTCETLGSTLG